jgi:hypothetical protein
VLENAPPERFLQVSTQDGVEGAEQPDEDEDGHA